MTTSRRRIVVSVLLGAAGVLFGLTAYLGYLGWFGGPRYRMEAAVPPVRANEVAVLFSGDTGLNAGVSMPVMRAFADHGLPVLGVNSLTVFATRRTPAQARAIVADAIRVAMRRSGASRVIVVGQSFGADMVQYAMATLDPALRRHVVQVILSVPGDTLLFKASPGGLLDGAPDAPALPSARRIDWVPVLCVHGTREPHSLCPLWHAPNVRVVALPGGHYLDHDAARLSATLWHAVAIGR